MQLICNETLQIPDALVAETPNETRGVEVRQCVLIRHPHTPRGERPSRHTGGVREAAFHVRWYECAKADDPLTGCAGRTTRAVFAASISDSAHEVVVGYHLPSRLLLNP